MTPADDRIIEDLAGFARNRVAHASRSVNDRLVWNTLRHDLPDLVARLSEAPAGS